MSEPLSERELIKLQIQAYEFYAGLIDRAVVSGAKEAKMPKWDEQRAVEYRDLAEQLRQRLAELEATDPQELNAPGVTPVATNGETGKS
ncbi:MAG: hypothetical protein ACM3N4_13800 [Nitrososphaerota archaeon]